MMHRLITYEAMNHDVQTYMYEGLTTHLGDMSTLNSVFDLGCRI